MNTKVVDIVLTDSQQAALNRINDFLDSEYCSVFILKGYAGTGKTTLVRAIVNEMEQRESCYTLLASTGRAAKVLGDAVRLDVDDKNCSEEPVIPTKTIHSQIYTFHAINQDMDLFDQSYGNPDLAKTAGKDIKLHFSLAHRDECSTDMVYIVDESSMITDAKVKSLSQAEYGTDGRLLRDMFEYDPNGKFIFIGDTCQLPPINQSFSPALNKKYIESTFGIAVDEVELTDVVRQPDGNDIVLSAARIRKLFSAKPVGAIAKFPFRGYRNIHILKNDFEMLNMYLECIKNKDYSRATMIVMSNKTVATVSSIVRPSLGFSRQTISVDDLLLVTQNNMVSGLMNGDLVRVLQIGRRERRAGLSFVYVEVVSLSTDRVYGQLLIEDVIYSGVTNVSQTQQTSLFVDYHRRMKEKGIRQRSPEYRDGMMKDPYLNALRCVFGYALTCHKAQGGEWDKVFLLIPRGLPYNDPRSYAYQWVYTAMTRAKKELYVLDDYWISM